MRCALDEEEDGPEQKKKNIIGEKEREGKRGLELDCCSLFFSLSLPLRLYVTAAAAASSSLAGVIVNQLRTAQEPFFPSLPLPLLLLLPSYSFLYM